MLENFFDLTSKPDTFTVSSANTLGMPIRGLGGSDFIVGSSNADVMLGNTGADNIYGLDGADTLHGGRGADLLFGNKGADWLLGERGNDVIFGGRGNDSLSGGEGDDFLAGDGGTDTLTGDDGSDAFVLDIRHSTSDRTLVDIITDFNNQDDGDVLALTDGANDTLTEADLTLETVGTDTFISLTSTGAFLAQVQGATAAEIAGTFSTVRSTLDDTEPGATILGLIPGQVTVQGQVGDEDYLDFFQFQVTETSIVDFSLTGLSADADLALYQDLDADGEVGEDEVISSSVRSDNADETIENVTLDPGKYFLSVEQFEGDTSYNLSVAGVAGTVARDLAGDRPSTARTLPPDGEVELHDYVGGTDGVDTYRLEVLNGGYLDVFADSPEAAVNLTLWSDRNDNNQLDVDEIVAYETNEMQQDFIDSGTYYVSVTAAGDPTPYKITGTASSGSRVDIESYNPLFPGIITTGSLSQNDDSDPNDPDNYADPYLLPELGAGLTVTVTQKSEDFDAYLRVVDLITGEAIAENDDIDTASGNYDAEVSFTTEQGGQYVVYASSVDAPGIGDYTLDATVTGTVTQTVLRSASTSNDNQLDEENDSSSGSDLLLPPPVWLEKGEGDDQGTRHEFVYKPLDGGQITSIKQIKDVNQGNFGNCAFLAALTATFGKIKDPKAAASATSEVLKNAIEDNGNNYTLTFYDYRTGEPANVTVDNQVVIKDFPNNKNLFGAKWVNEDVTFGQASGQPIWGSIFERAYAKWRGQQDGRNGYDVTGNGDQPGFALKRVTGENTEFILFNPSESKAQVAALPSDNSEEFSDLGKIEFDAVFNRIQTALNEGRYVVAGTKDVDNDNKLYGGVLVETHAYSVHNAYVDDLTNQKMILLRNPWGIDNRGKTIEKNGEQQIKPIFATEDPSPEFKDGFVAITFNAFLKNFMTLSLTKA